MKATLICDRPTNAALAAGRPALTPELTAAVGARFSRSNEGLASILGRVDPADEEKSINSILKMVDYGHASIADMATVNICLEGLSLYLIAWLWDVSPTASGQETSTRYCKFDGTEIVVPAFTAASDHHDFVVNVNKALAAYLQAVDIWQQVFDANPNAAKIPKSLLDDTSAATQLKVQRLRKNYVFDRARCWLPLCCTSSVFLKLPARKWVELTQSLLSHPIEEFRAAGVEIVKELGLVVPHLVKHAVPKRAWMAYHQDEFDLLHSSMLGAPLDGFPDALHPDRRAARLVTESTNTLFTAEHISNALARDAMKYHDNRYAPVGSLLERTQCRFSCFTDIGCLRDFRRHRTGYKYTRIIPAGFYWAGEELPLDAPRQLRDELGDLALIGRDTSLVAYDRLMHGDPSYVYWLLLGTQVYYEHGTSLKHFIYEGELRAGPGAHYRYAAIYRQALEQLYAQFPDLRGLILEGSAEPE